MVSRQFMSLVVMSCVFAGAVNGLAQEFRVESEIFTTDDKEPVAESLTIFSGNVVYDYLFGEAEEITVFDVQRGRIVLLDPRQQIKAELTTEKLFEFCTAIKALPAAKKNPTLFNPQFQPTFDQERALLTLTSDHISYKAKGVEPKQPDGAKRFQQFADWYARLNAMRPGNLPPFGRIELNKQLAAHNLIPLEIERTVVLDRPVADKKVVVRSKHAVIWQLSFTDRKRIETAAHYQSQFRQVSPEEYWHLDQIAARSK